jgi:two-component system response regulator FixJ
MSQASYLVHIVSDHPPVREPLDRLLRHSGYETHLYDGAGGLLANLPNLGDGCILLDAELQSIAGLELAEQLHSSGSTLPMILMVGPGDIRTAVRVLKLGAVDVVEKPFTDQKLLTAIAMAKAGPRIIADPEPHIAEAQAAMATLSTRERQVLTGLAAGQSNKVIAYELGISARTVEIHRTRMLHRLHSLHLAGAIRIAVLAQLGGSP